MNSLKEELIEKMCEELKDADMYLEMSKIAEADGERSLAKGLEEMALDEVTHADFLRDSLISAGHYHPHEHTEIEEKWNEALHVFGIQK